MGLGTSDSLNDLLGSINIPIDANDLEFAAERLESALAVDPENPQIDEFLKSYTEAVLREDIQRLLERAGSLLEGGMEAEARRIAEWILKERDQENQEALQILERCYDEDTEDSLSGWTGNEVNIQDLVGVTSQVPNRLGRFQALRDLAVDVTQQIRQGNLHSARQSLAVARNGFPGTQLVDLLTSHVNEVESKYQQELKRAKSARQKKRFVESRDILQRLIDQGLHRPAVQKLMRKVERALEKAGRAEEERVFSQRGDDFDEREDQLDQVDGAGAAGDGPNARFDEIRGALGQGLEDGRQEVLVALFREVESLLKLNRFTAARLEIERAERDLRQDPLLDEFRALLQPRSRVGDLKWIPQQPKESRLEMRLVFEIPGAEEVVVTDLLLKRDGLLVKTLRDMGKIVAPGHPFDDFPFCKRCELELSRPTRWGLHEQSLEAKIRLTTGEFRSATARLPCGARDVSKDLILKSG